ncbi:RelA/SpoT domain-containing protein [Acidovorax sp. MR-S7]|uniref:RelA/SpoT domain-containing protein n=1 Tax=Acidovorax sp. MR-S7 TaxID=1268622 RepID=UPI0006725096|nr:RelA/SpoT domain-containing protein [Acidovorax sp. MR-S7]
MPTTQEMEKRPARAWICADGLVHNRRTMSDGFVKPGASSKVEIRRAGDAIAAGTATQRDEEIVQEWRDCHAYVLNTFQNTLRRWIRDEPYVMVQRLKRLRTVRDKLATGRAANVSSMHDLAGCRIIFPDVRALTQFREVFHAGTRSSHEYASSGKYDYLANPKSTGYRGFHDVFKYHVANAPGNAWNGLRVEIQYRTNAQHAWATAVEISDLIDNARVKFDRGTNQDRERLFVLASEYIARNSESMFGAAPDLTDAQVEGELMDLEHRLGVLARLRALSAGAVGVPNNKNLVLMFDNNQLAIEPFKSSKQAMTRRNQIEIDKPDVDVVYIRAEKPNEVANAFRNYFRDARGFLDLLPRF